MVEGVAVMFPLLPDTPTLILTLTVCVVLPETSEMVPLQVVPLAIPAGYTATVMGVFVALACRLPLGEIPSQLTLVQVCVEVDALKLVAVVAVTFSVFDEVATTLGNCIDEVLSVSGPDCAAPPFTTSTTG
jgi:hypothetical protein